MTTTMITTVTTVTAADTAIVEHSMGPGGPRLPGPRPVHDERGFALLIVLLALGLLALLATHFAVAGRTHAALANNERAAAQVEAATAGAIQAEIIALLRSPDAINAPSQLRIGATLVRLIAENEATRLNPNRAQAIELAALLQQVGADALSSAAIAAAILDWRTDGTDPRPGGAKAPQYRAAGRAYGPPGTPFRSVAELGQVLGMTPTLLDRLRPHLTVFTDFGPLGVSSDPVVARALQAAAQAGALPQGGDLGAIAVVRITAVGFGPNGASITLQAVVRLNATPNGLPFEILSWQRIAT